jgi:hypothetical protein
MTMFELIKYDTCFKRITRHIWKTTKSIAIEWEYGNRDLVTPKYKSPFFWILYKHVYRNKISRVKVGHNTLFLTEMTIEEGANKIIEFLLSKIRVTQKVKQNLGLL